MPSPILILVPVLAAVFGPRLWAAAELRRFDVEDDAFLPADALARRLLDRQGLTLVRVEVTDLGDHYDPRAKAVRINRAHFQRSSLTAATTAAHEVGHALQDASDHWALRLHTALARLAQVTNGVGTVLLLAVPAAAIAAKTPAPSRLLGLTAAGMLGTGLAAQLAALPSELDASMQRALPLLRDCCLADAQVRDARRILLACSLTYLGSAAAPALALWPFVGAGLARFGLLAPLFAPAAGVAAPLRQSVGCAAPQVIADASAPVAEPRAARAGRVISERRARLPRLARALTRTLARPLVRRWLLVTGAY